MDDISITIKIYLRNSDVSLVLEETVDEEMEVVGGGGGHVIALNCSATATIATIRKSAPVFLVLRISGNSSIRWALVKTPVAPMTMISRAIGSIGNVGNTSV
jgi:hypothetical protein